ncbi:MAG TPA: hypothetical protein VKY85_20120 [Candidatus Angelobacter sp.]|nr:hypothetical protein [Candidatus Angelobacter sp.]
MSAQGLNLLVFRDGRQVLSGSAAKTALSQHIRLAQRSFHPAENLSSLLQAGELECALADSAAGTAQFETITDAMAEALVNGAPVPNVENLPAILDSTPVPERLAVSIPEGFAFYALHPLAYAEVVQQFAALPPRVAVIGIRSVGTTLSAVTAAALKRRGVQAARTTVRPTGHPYNRRMEFSGEQLEFVRREISASGIFLVVDEGPGLSGSSFLSVAEALVQAGVAAEKITLVCSHAVDADHLCAENAAKRWRKFRSIAVSTEPRQPLDAQVWVGGGEWRRYLLRDEPDWPASWVSFERLKYFSGRSIAPRFYKFAGYGRYGEEVRQREEKVAAAGFGPAPEIASDGYMSYPFVDGRPMAASDLAEGVLARLAAYCAYRAGAFPAEVAAPAALQQMAQHNLRELEIDVPLELRLERGVIADGRMQPHEWLLTRQGQMRKCDSGSHGDDHFFPGATDIAWDLAGAIVEWQMDAEEAESFLEMYRRASGDNAQTRVLGYITAYTVFRYAYCRMAANALQGMEEQARLERAADCYRARLFAVDFADIRR